MKQHYNLSSCVTQLRKLIEEKDDKIEFLLAEILMLKKQMNINETNNEEKEREMTERAEEIKVKLERTENMFQNKEKKWSELERIVVNYARKDLHLRNKLSEIKYICDDPSSKRRITTVVEENERLRTEIDEIKSEMEELKSQVDCAKSNPTFFDDEEDYFKLGDQQFQDDEVPMEKKTLGKRSNKNNLSALSDMRGPESNLNQAFLEKSKSDNSGIADSSNILGNLKDQRYNTQGNYDTPPKQNLCESFGPGMEENKQGEEKFFKIGEDLLISGSNMKPNTFEITHEISELEKSIGSIGHNRSLSRIKYPKSKKELKKVTINPKKDFCKELREYFTK